MNELEEFKNLFEESIILILEILKKELEKEEEQKNDNIDNH